MDHASELLDLQIALRTEVRPFQTQNARTVEKLIGLYARYTSQPQFHGVDATRAMRLYVLLP